MDQSLIALAVVAGAALYLGRRALPRRKKPGKAGKNCGCGTDSAGSCGKKDPAQRGASSLTN